jgi:hypothetical protein
MIFIALPVGPDKLGAENEKLGVCPESATYLIYFGFLPPYHFGGGGSLCYVELNLTHTIATGYF